MDGSANVIDPARIADIDATQPGPRSVRGSGYRVLPDVVLTAAHVVAGAGSVRVRFNADRPDEWSADTTRWWTAGDLAALLITPRPEDASLPASRFGRIPDRAQVFRAETVGFPLWKLRDDPGVYRDSHHAHGEIAGLSNRREGTLELTVTPPSDPHPDVSPWEGMSGAAVWVDGRIVGVVGRHHRTDGAGRLAVHRIDACGHGDVRARLGLADVPSVHTPSPAELAAGAYQAQVHELAPPALLDRADELAELTGFCLGDDRYAWWQAAPWAGKTALMSRFVADSPPGLDVVSFFVTGRLLHQSDCDAFVDAMCDQLAALVGEPAPARGPAYGRFRLLLRDATARARELGRRLVLVVDGLDEDTGRERHRPSIASLLPPDAPPELRVLVTSRPGFLPDDLDGEHPLRSCPVRRLTASPHAKDIERRARADLDRALNGAPLERDVLGLLAASGGGLAPPDLATLTAVTTSEVDAVLSGAAGRCVTRRPLAFSHNALAETVRDRVGPALARYRDRLHAWAAEHRERGWPDDTPFYLLRDYPRLLADAGDAAALVALVSDRRRHELMFERTGSDGLARTEIVAAQDMVRDDPEPDLTTLLGLAIHRNDLAVRSELPAEAPVAWAALGRVDLAESVINGFADDSRRAACLAAVASVVASAGDAERADSLADQAETIVAGLEDRPTGTALTIQLAYDAAERHDHGRADRLARAAEPFVDELPNQGLRANCWAVMAKTAAKTGDTDRAAALVTRLADTARAIEERSSQLRCRATHAGVLHVLSEVDRAEVLLREVAAEVHGLEESEDRGWALARLVAVHAEAGDLDRADALSRELTAKHYRAEAWKSLAEGFARAGEFEHARTLADEIPVDMHRAAAFAALARIGAGHHDHAHDDLARAVEIARETNRVEVLTSVANGLAAAGALEQALRLAETLPTPDTLDTILGDLADRLEQDGDVRGAEKAVARIHDPDKRKLQVVGALTYRARKRRLRWYRRDRKKAADTAFAIRSPSCSAYALSLVAAASAVLGDHDWYETFMDEGERHASAIDYPDSRASVLEALAMFSGMVGDEARAAALRARRDSIVARMTSVQYREAALRTDIRDALAAREWDRAEEIIGQIAVMSQYRDDGLVELCKALAEHGEYDRAERTMREIDGSAARGTALVALAEKLADGPARRLVAEALTTAAWPKTTTMLRRLAPEAIDLLVAAYSPTAEADRPRVRSVPWAVVRERREEAAAERDRRAAAESGDAEAMADLGRVLSLREDPEAEVWLRRAAQAGDARGMSLLALQLGAGSAEAREWGRRAAGSADPRARYNLALLCEDTAEAERWYLAAAEAGAPPAMVALGDILLDRDDETGAERWFRRAADDQDPDGLCRLGVLSTRRGDHAGAEAWFLAAAARGQTWAMYCLGATYDAEMDRVAEAVRWYVNAAERGVPEAMHLLGLHYWDTGDRDEAEYWLRSATDAGDPESGERLSALLDERRSG